MSDNPFNNTGIVFLQLDDFDGTTLKSNEKVFVMVQGDFCGACTQAKPGFVNASAQCNSNVLFATIKTDGDQTEKALLQTIKKIDPSIKGVPTYLLFNGGKYVETYDGKRDATDICKFLSQ